MTTATRLLLAFLLAVATVTALGILGRILRSAAGVLARLRYRFCWASHRPTCCACGGVLGPVTHAVWGPDDDPGDAESRCQACHTAARTGNPAPYHPGVTAAPIGHVATWGEFDAAARAAYPARRPVTTADRWSGQIPLPPWWDGTGDADSACATWGFDDLTGLAQVCARPTGHGGRHMTAFTTTSAGRPPQIVCAWPGTTAPTRTDLTDTTTASPPPRRDSVCAEQGHDWRPQPGGYGRSECARCRTPIPTVTTTSKDTTR